MREDTPDDACKLLAEWSNADQDQNAATSDGQLLLKISAAVVTEQKRTGLSQVNTSIVISNVLGNSLVKLTSSTVACYVKLILALGVNSVYSQEFFAFLANHVRSGEISVPTSVMEETVKSIGSANVLVMLNLLELAYCSDGSQKQARPRPDIAKFITTSDITALAKAGGKLKLINDFLTANREKTEKVDQGPGNPMHYPSIVFWGMTGG